MKQRIPGYARVSSREQAQNSHALEQQIARLRAAGATEIYFDVESRSKDDREDLNKILHLIETRQCDEAVFIRIDRLTDSSVLLERVIRICLDSDIRIRGLDDSIDLHTVGGRLHARILVNIARGEVERLSERVRHGWEYLRKRKVAMNPPFGYVKVDDRHQQDHSPFLCLLACPVEPLIDRQNRTVVELPVEFSAIQIADCLVSAFFQHRTIRRTLRWMNETYGIQTFAHNQATYQRGGRVAKKMFRFSPGGFRNWLTNPVLQGHLSYLRGGEYKGRAEVHYDTHPDQRLITDEEAQQIESILNHNRQVRGFGSTALKYPLSGLVFCGECRSSCYSMTGQNNYHRAKRLGIAPEINYYFQCKNWRTRSCSQKTLIRMEVAEAAVITALTQRAEAITLLAEQPIDAVDPPELQALKAELAYYQQAPGNRAAGIVADLHRQIEELRHRQTSVGHQQLANRELLLRIFEDRLYWETLPDEEKRDIYRALVERVTVKDGQVVNVALKV